MQRLYACSDIHGKLDKFLVALITAGLVDENGDWKAHDSKLVLCGDYIDRGPDSKGVVDQIIKMREQAPNFTAEVIALRGNHEQMMLDGLKDRAEGQNWLSNGGRQCAISYGFGASVYTGLYSPYVTEKILKVHGDFFLNLPHYHVDGDNLFVHAGLHPNKKLEELGVNGDIVHLWVRNPFFQHSDPATYLLKEKYGVTRVIFGHTVHRGQVTPYFGGQHLCIDTGSFLEDGKITVVELYPDLVYEIAGQSK
jgi:serine/threonine protein phosphatase 1